MENSLVRSLLELHGLTNHDWQVDRYRTANQGLNENGRGCRIFDKNRHINNTPYIAIESAKTFPENAKKAISAMADIVNPESKRSPILELLAEYEAEECNFEDPAWVTSTALQYVEQMRDCQVRCLLYTLAKAMSGFPYKRPKEKKVPVKAVELVGEVAKATRKQIIQELEQFTGGQVELTFNVRTSKLKSGVVKKLYGSIKVIVQPKLGRERQMHHTHRKLGEILQRLADVPWTPYVYSTSASNRYNGFETTFRVVCQGEDDYEQWTRCGV